MSLNTASRKPPTFRMLLRPGPGWSCTAGSSEHEGGLTIRFTAADLKRKGSGSTAAAVQWNCRLHDGLWQFGQETSRKTVAPRNEFTT